MRRPFLRSRRVGWRIEGSAGPVLMLGCWSRFWAVRLRGRDSRGLGCVRCFGVLWLGNGFRGGCGAGVGLLAEDRRHLLGDIFLASFADIYGQAMFRAPGGNPVDQPVSPVGEGRDRSFLCSELVGAAVEFQSGLSGDLGKALV